MNQNQTLAQEQDALKASSKHPKGLWVLFGTEMWERFNFYGMRTLLTLFIVHSLMMSEETSSLIYGGFLGLCYLTPMLGGFISDRFLGNRYCIMLGGSLMAIGQLLLFFSASTFDTNLGLAKILLYVALGVIIFGNGFFKPNISSMVGSLYPAQEKNKLDTAFTIFYMGINVGAFLGQFICPMLGDVVDAAGNRDIFAFKWGFLAASAAMVIGTVSFYFLKDKYVKTPEGRPIGGLPKHNTASDFAEGEAQKAHFTSTALTVSVIAFIALSFIFHKLFGQNIIYSIIYGSGLTLAGLILSDKSLTKIERDRVLVIYIVSFFVIFFWAAFEQAGSSLTFIANNQTDRNFFGWSMPPSMVQIFNGIFVVAFAVPFSMLWDKLRTAGKEPISPFKQAIGLFLIALSYFIIAFNVKDLGYSGLLAIKWLILLYLIQTFGELCLSPIGLSLVGKLAPKRFASLLFGVFFLSNASGYALAGTLGSILPATGDKFLKAKEAGIDLQAVLDKTVTPTAEQLKFLTANNINHVNPVFAGFEIHNLFEFFMVFVILCGVASVLLFALTPKLKKMMHGIR
ncbi:peptide MFS transporter [Solitalea canadensis]|uniref:Amino acid/peptide transporter (Peptide:H symporter) n=1 Tax=Solitalea canadensis (strain ATCC 29591 / DSM 3403 / JCM 21819 / LMG 8368 / NBRC 15130 / NCIMB 12057 / USAM 9D) TaxID=929556 RepID=H8KVM2_SOLCM|nr:peptide MFS transporter [Solitalea canadensis]AFD06525.1 amino acid/peptide transporter (peptide:H symporter) [Solitalea canadensis DSM 3403]